MDLLHDKLTFYKRQDHHRTSILKNITEPDPTRPVNDVIVKMEGWVGNARLDGVVRNLSSLGFATSTQHTYWLGSNRYLEFCHLVSLQPFPAFRVFSSSVGHFSVRVAGQTAKLYLGQCFTHRLHWVWVTYA